MIDIFILPVFSFPTFLEEHIGSVTSLQLMVSVEANLNIVLVNVSELRWFIPPTSWIVELLRTRQRLSFMICECVLAVTVLFVVSILVIIVLKIFVLPMLVRIMLLNMVVLALVTVLLVVMWWWWWSIRTRTNTSTISAVVRSGIWPLLKKWAVSIYKSWVSSPHPTKGWLIWQSFFWLLGKTSLQNHVLLGHFIPEASPLHGQLFHNY